MRELARVVLRDVARVGIRRQHLLDAIPEAFELLLVLFARQIRCRDLLARQREQLALAVEFRHEGPKGMREPLGRAALGDHRIGDKPRHRRVAHAFDERAHHVDAAGHGLGPLPLGEERDHRLHREVPGASSELLEDGVELLRVGTADVVDQPSHDVEERRRLKLDALRALGSGFLQPLHQLFELG